MPLFFLGILLLAVGIYAINRGKNLAEGELAGGLGTYWNRTGFIVRGIAAAALGIFILIMETASVLSW
jgi:hypothetical protein